MYRSEIELMGPPGNGRNLPVVQKAADDISAALATCLAAFDATQPAIKQAAKVSSNEIAASSSPMNSGAFVTRRIEKAVADFRTKSLPEFLRVRGEQAGIALAEIEAERRRIEAELQSRVERLGRALGRIIQDDEAGQDLAGIFTRLAGIAPDLETQLRLIVDARNSWHAAVKCSCGLLRGAAARAASLPSPEPTLDRESAILKFNDMTGEK